MIYEQKTLFTYNLGLAYMLTLSTTIYWWLATASNIDLRDCGEGGDQSGTEPKKN